MSEMSFGWTSSSSLDSISNLSHFITGRQEGGVVRDPISATGKEEAEHKLAECKLQSVNFLLISILSPKE